MHLLFCSVLFMGGIFFFSSTVCAGELLNLCMGDCSAGNNLVASLSTTGISLDLIRFLFVCFLTLLFKTFLLFQPVNQSVNCFTQSKRNQLSLDWHKLIFNYIASCNSSSLPVFMSCFLWIKRFFFPFENVFLSRHGQTLARIICSTVLKGLTVNIYNNCFSCHLISLTVRVPAEPHMNLRHLGSYLEA